MLYAGIDYHKRYSQVHVIDHSGRTRTTARLVNDGLTVGKFFKSLEEPCAAVLEAGWNWGVMYDWLAAIDNIKQVELAHHFWVRAIAAAQVKTDAIDAHTLAQLLRSDLIPRPTYLESKPDGCAKSCVSAYSWCGYEPWLRIASTRS